MANLDSLNPIRSSSTYIIPGRQPLDQKQKVLTYGELINPEYWKSTNPETGSLSTIAYNGMFATVSNDSDTSKRGLYVLLDSTIPSDNTLQAPVINASNWHKVASLDELANYATNGDLSAIAQRVTALEESSSDSIGIDSFDTAYFKLNDQQKITLNNILSEYVEGTDYASNPAIPTVGFVTSIVEGKIDAAHKVTSTQRRYKVITDGAPDFANPPSFDSMDDFGTATPNIVQGNWMWSATRLTYENEGTITSYALSYVGKDGAPGTNGSDGTDGTDGTNGYTPYIEDGYWFINNETTGVKAQGPAGPSYISQIANQTIDANFTSNPNNKVKLFCPAEINNVSPVDTTGELKLDSDLYVSVYDDNGSDTNEFTLRKLVIDDGILE